MLFVCFFAHFQNGSGQWIIFHTQWSYNEENVFPQNSFHSHIIIIQGTSKQYYELMVLSVNKEEGGVADKRDQCSGHDLRKQTRKKALKTK